MTTNNDNDKQAVALDPTVDFVAGTVAGVVGIVSGYPFDTVKVRLQSPQHAHKYRGTFHAINKIVREERLFGLYKGIMSPLATCALLNGMVFSSYKFFINLQTHDPKVTPTIAQVALAGAGTGIACSIIMSPVELIKIQQQTITSRNSPLAKSVLQVASRIYRRHGILGLYRGVVSTALRDLGYGSYFAMYEFTCRSFKPPRTSPENRDHTSIIAEVEDDMHTLSWPVLMLAGGLAGIAGWITTFPFDVIKTRIQSSGVDLSPIPTTSHVLSPSSLYTNPQSSLIPAGASSQHRSMSTRMSSGAAEATALGGHANPYRGIISTTIASYRAEGLGVFWKGLAPTLLRSIPVNMLTFLTFETVAHALS